MSETQKRAGRVIRQSLIDWVRNHPAYGPQESVGNILAAMAGADLVVMEKSDTTDCDRTLERQAIAAVSAIPGMPDGWWEDHSILRGLVVVDAGRFERVAGDAERWRKFSVTGLTPDGTEFYTSQPGDLDPIPAKENVSNG